MLWHRLRTRAARGNVGAENSLTGAVLRSLAADPARLRLGEGAEQLHLVDAATKISGPEQTVGAEPRRAGRQHHPVAP